MNYLDRDNVTAEHSERYCLLVLPSYRCCRTVRDGMCHRDEGQHESAIC
jgi:hypothetical protein